MPLEAKSLLGYSFNETTGGLTDNRTRSVFVYHDKQSKSLLDYHISIIWTVTYCFGIKISK
jgi:hypothetical protein